MQKNAKRLRLSTEQRRIGCKQYRIGSVPLHWHDFYEIELVTDGVGTHTVNGTAYEWRRGEMHLMRLVDFHEIELAGELRSIPASTRRLSSRPESIKPAMGTMQAPSVIGMLSESRRFTSVLPLIGTSSGFCSRRSKRFFCLK